MMLRVSHLTPNRLLAEAQRWVGYPFDAPGFVRERYPDVVGAAAIAWGGFFVATLLERAAPADPRVRHAIRPLCPHGVIDCGDDHPPAHLRSAARTISRMIAVGLAHRVRYGGPTGTGPHAPEPGDVIAYRITHGMRNLAVAVVDVIEPTGIQVIACHHGRLLAHTRHRGSIDRLMFRELPLCPRTQLLKRVQYACRIAPA